MQLQRTQPIGVSSVARGFRVGQINRGEMQEEAEIQTVRQTGKRICSSRATDLRNLQLTLPSTSLTLWSAWDWQCSARYPSAKSSSNCPIENVPFFAACTASYLVAVSHSLPIPDLSQWSRWSGRCCCRHCRRRGFFAPLRSQWEMSDKHLSSFLRR